MLIINVFIKFKQNYFMLKSDVNNILYVNIIKY